MCWGGFFVPLFCIVLCIAVPEVTVEDTHHLVDHSLAYKTGSLRSTHRRLALDWAWPLSIIDGVGGPHEAFRLSRSYRQLMVTGGRRYFFGGDAASKVLMSL